MATTSVTVRMDEDLKRQAETFFAEIGMNMTTAFTVFVKAVVRQQKIPFEISLDPFYSHDNMARLRKAAADIENGNVKLTQHELLEADDD